MSPVGSVEPKQMGHLAADAAVNIFRQLLWAEAAQLGLHPSLISVPGPSLLQMAGSMRK